MFRFRASLLLASFLLVAMLCGCSKDEEYYEEEGPTPTLAGQLEPGVPLSISLWGEPADYTFYGKAGEVIDLIVTRMAPGLDPNVRLLDPSGQEEAFNDDGGGSGNALIQGYRLESTGTYTVRIETDEDQPGEVSVLLTIAGRQPESQELLMTTEVPMRTDSP
jgi:hypothetical protein